MASTDGHGLGLRFVRAVDVADRHRHGGAVGRIQAKNEISCVDLQFDSVEHQQPGRCAQRGVRHSGANRIRFDVFNFGTPDQPGAASYEIGATYYDQYANLASDPFLMIDTDEVPERYFLVEAEGQTAPPTPLSSGMTVYENSATGLVPVEINVIAPGAEPPTDNELLSRTIDSSTTPGRISDKSWYYLRLPFGRGVLAGAMTLMLVILPVIIISAQEALRAVPGSLRDGARGLGSTPWQVVWNVTLPAAIPGIMTGSILAMSRAIGETAPILIIAGIVYIRNSPEHLMDSYTVLPLQIYNWTSRPQVEFHSIAAGGIIILLAILLSFNAVAVLIRYRMQRKLS